jgi:DNA-binding IscR family transcriptional regulator
MRINKKLEIAINAVALLRGRAEPTCTSSLAAEVGTTVNFLEQIMRNLRMADIVQVKRGPGGGYYHPNRLGITAMEIAKAVGYDVESDCGNMPSDQLKVNLTAAFMNTIV